jgi:RsiW-degrading membrane proteinase PrsW (M82 family)
MGSVEQQSGGKRKGARKGARPPRRFRRDVFALALATTVAVIAWGYLVYAAVDFGSDARGGDGKAWALLALAAIGAAACLFAALLLVARIIRALSAAPISPGSAASGPPTDSHRAGH